MGDGFEKRKGRRGGGIKFLSMGQCQLIFEVENRVIRIGSYLEIFINTTQGFWIMQGESQ